MIEVREIPLREAVIDIGKFNCKRLTEIFSYNQCIGEIYNSKDEYMASMAPAVNGSLTRMATIDAMHSHHVKGIYVKGSAMHIMYHSDVPLHFAPRFLGNRDKKEGVLIAMDAYPEEDSK